MARSWNDMHRVGTERCQDNVRQLRRRHRKDIRQLLRTVTVS